MEQKRLIERLADVEKHIAIGKVHIERQQQLIDELVASGEPAANVSAIQSKNVPGIAKPMNAPSPPNTSSRPMNLSACAAGVT